MECPRCLKKIKPENILPLTLICDCGWHDEHMAKTAQTVFNHQIKRVSVVLTAFFALTMTARFAVDKAQARAARHEVEIAQQAKLAANQRARMALRAGAHRYPASIPNHGYVRARSSKS